MEGFVLVRELIKPFGEFRQLSCYVIMTNKLRQSYGTIFCKHGFLFCATLNIFNQHESSFGCHIIFFVATSYFFVTHTILLRNVNFYVKYFLVFCATQDFFVLLNVSVKNIVNK